MRDRPFALELAKQSLQEPFRQTTLMPTVEFAKFLRDRDIGFDASDLVGFAEGGLILPIAVLSAVPLRSSSFPPLARTEDGLIYAVRGPRFRFERLRANVQNDRTLLWHPFQMLMFKHVHRILSATNRINITAVLDGKHHYSRYISNLLSRFDLRARLTAWVESTDYHQLEAIISLAIAAEPRVIDQLSSHIRLNVLPMRETLEQYNTWLAATDPSGILMRGDIDVDTIRKWHRAICVRTDIEDPLRDWRVLLRFSPRSKRLKLRGLALQAEESYYLAEILRRFLERYAGVTDLPDEDRVTLGDQVATSKEQFYGRRTTTDGDRSVFRQVAREFHLDPQPRMRWLIEGATEHGFIERWAERNHYDLTRLGIEVVQLYGVGDLDSQRVRTLLELSRDEEVFVYPTVDGDRNTHRPRILHSLAKQGLLPAGWMLFDPDFEEANFSLGDLAEAANRMAQAEGRQTSFTGGEVHSARRGAEPIGKTIEGLLRSAGCVEGRKGRTWGRILGDVLPLQGETPPPIVQAFASCLRSNTSNYRFTVQLTDVNENGTTQKLP